MPGHTVSGLQPGRARWLPSELGTSAAARVTAEFQLPCTQRGFLSPIFIATAPAAVPSATSNRPVLGGTCLPQG